MLWGSGASQVIQKMNMQADSTANAARKEEAAKRLNFYHDQQLDRLNEQLNELFSDPSSMVLTELNITKKIINNLAQVYREPPVRTIDGSEKDQELYKSIAESCNIDMKLKQASRYTKLVKTILLRPVWRNDKLDLDILTGNILDVETGDSPEDLQKVLVTDYGSTDKVEDIVYNLWNADYWQRLDYRGNLLDEAENPYGVLPFLPVFDYIPTTSSFWLVGGDDLVSLQETINLKLTDLMYLLTQQSFGVGYLKGEKGGGSVKVDPGSLVELSENGEIGFVSQKAEIEQVVNAIDKLVKWACVSHGLSASSMSTDPTEQSGISKIVDNQELTEARKDDISNFRNVENQIFNLIRIINNVHSEKKLSDKAQLNIDFHDPTKETTSPKEQSETWNLQLSMGVISLVDILLEKNPDFQGDREKALSHLLTIQEETKLLTE